MPEETKVARQSKRAHFTKGRETKGTIVFDEVKIKSGVHRMVRTLYLRKEAYAALGSPEALNVTITAAEI